MARFAGRQLCVCRSHRLALRQSAPGPGSECAFFPAHSLGYFTGGKLMYFLTSPTGAELFNSLTKAELGSVAELSWGLLYGLGFGAGLGYAFHVFQKPRLLRHWQ